MEEALNSTLSTESHAESRPADSVQEVAWIRASQQGDTLAFNRLVLRWEKSIYNLTLRMLQDPEDAAEVTQEVFLSAYRNVRRFRHEARFSTWLYRIAANHCITRLRQRPQGVHCSIDDDHSVIPIEQALPAQRSHESEFLREEIRNQVRGALRQLNPDQRIVVELKFFQELTFNDIAAILQLPVSTIKSRLYSGFEVLKGRLGNAAKHSVNMTANTSEAK